MNFKINNRYLLTFGVIILCMVTFSDLKAQAQVNEKAEAKAFVKKFYDWYVPLSNKPIDRKNPVSPIAVLKQRPEYFDEPLRKAFLDDAAAQAKYPGELVGLDFDPFLDANDNVLGYKLGNVKQVGNKFQIEVSVGDHIIAEVMKAGGSWKFTNFFYPNNKQYTLLQVLASLRNGREKMKPNK